MNDLRVFVNTTKAPTQPKTLLLTDFVFLTKDFASPVHPISPHTTLHIRGRKVSLIFLSFRMRKNDMEREKFNFIFTAQKSEDLELRDKSAKL